MVRLTQHDVAACREAFASHDGDAARLRAMMEAVKQPVSDADIMDMCSQVAVTRPLHAVLGDSAEGGGGPGGVGGGAPGGGGVHGNAAVDASGDSGFDMLLRMVEDKVAGVEDEEEDVRLAFMALGGNADGTGTVSASKMKAVVKDFGLLVDIDKMLALTAEGTPAETLEYAQFKELLIVQSSSLSMCVEQQAALERGPMFASLMRFRAPNLTGRWRKDVEESESLDIMAEALHLPWVLRRAAGFARDLQIHHDEAVFSTSVCAGIIRLKESFPLTGEPRTHARRDMRRGGARGRVCSAGGGLLDRLAQSDGQMVIKLQHEWAEPHAAVATETFIMSEDLRRLTVDTQVVLKDGSSRSMRALYRRL